MEPILESETPPPILEFADENPLSTMDCQRSKPTKLPTPGKGTGGLFILAGAYIFASLLYGAGFGFYLGVTGAIADGAANIGEVMMTHLTSINGFVGLYSTQFVCLMPLMGFVSKFKKQSISTTLALKSVPIRTLGFWLGAWVLYEVGGYLIGLIIEQPDSPFLLQFSGSKSFPLSIVFVLLAPILEETFFRGYMFKAWRNSWLGSYGTILATSFIFTMVHAGQYDITILLHLFVLAHILGFARERTGSLFAPIAIHMANNILSTILVVYMGIV